MTRRPKGSGGAHWSESRQRWIAEIGRQSRSFRETRKQRTDQAPAAVNRWLAEEAARLARGEPPPSAQPLRAYLQEWLATIIKPHRSETTDTTYGSVIKRHVLPVLGDVPLGALTPQQVQRLLNDLMAERDAAGQPRYAAGTIAQVRGVLHTALGQAVAWGLIPRNPVTATERPRVEEAPLPRVLDRDEARAFLAAAAGERLGALLVVGLVLGLRRGELQGLRWQDVDLVAGRLTVAEQRRHRTGRGMVPARPKTNSGRTILLPAVVVAALTRRQRQQAAERDAAGERWQEHGLVFCSTLGTPLWGSQVYTALRRTLTAAKLPPTTLHALRHSAASLLTALGVDSATIMQILGHRQMRMLQRYSHSLESSRRAAAERLDAALGPDRPADRPAASA